MVIPTQDSKMKKLLLAVIMLIPVQFLQAQERVGDFALLDQQGNFHQVSRYNHREAVVLLSEGANCNSFSNALSQFDETH